MKINFILIFGLSLFTVLLSCTKKGTVNYSSGGTLPSKNIAIIQGGYSPNDVTLPRGTYVTFSNLTDQNHNLLSSDLTTLDSVFVEKGKSYTHQFQNAGIFEYRCIDHSEQGVIRISN